jgi:hypothetical protein
MFLSDRVTLALSSEDASSSELKEIVKQLMRETNAAKKDLQDAQNHIQRLRQLNEKVCVCGVCCCGVLCGVM